MCTKAFTVFPYMCKVLILLVTTLTKYIRYTMTMLGFTVRVSCTYAVLYKASPVFLGEPPSTSQTKTSKWRWYQNLDQAREWNNL